MRPVLLIAGNFVREQRWLTMLLVLYAVGGAVMFGYGEGRVASEDVAFFLNQQAVYAILFSLFMGSFAIQNERKTRRIIAVLSKAITRRQYITGLLMGVTAIFLVYCVAIGLAGTWLTRPSPWNPRELWISLGCIALVSLLTAALTIFYSTFLTPLFATVAAAITLGLPAALEHTLGQGWKNFVPVYALLMWATHATLDRNNPVHWRLLAITVLETALLWTAATIVFARCDVTAEIE